jgi:hypothetical protein
MRQGKIIDFFREVIIHNLDLSLGFLEALIYCCY